MDTVNVISLFRVAIWQTMLISAPVLIIGAVAGLILSIFQATTSLQDQTLTFVPKIFAIFGALAYFGPWMMNILVAYTENLFSMIPNIVG